MKGEMLISNETRKALKYMANVMESRRGELFAPHVVWTAIEKAVNGFREDERRAQGKEGAT